MSKTKTKLPAVPAGFASVGGMTEAQQQEHQSNNMPWIGFQSKSGETAIKVARAIPDIETGQPFLSMPDGRYFPLKDARVFVLPALSYEYVIHYQKGAESKKALAYYKDWPTSVFEALKGNDNEYLSEAFDFVCVVLLPEGLDVDSVVALSRFEGSRRFFVKNMLKSIANTMKPEWEARGDLEAAHIKASVPPGFRVIGGFKVVKKTSKKGNVYINVYANEETATKADLSRLDGLEFDDASAAFEKRTGYVKNQIKD